MYTDEGMNIKILEDGEIHNAESQVDSAIQQHQVNIGKGVFQGIGFPVLHMGKQQFQPDDNQVDGGGDKNQPLFFNIIHHCAPENKAIMWKCP